MLARSLRLLGLVLLFQCIASGPGGAQGFQTALRRNYSFGSGTRSPVLADFNGDGKLDAVVANQVTDSLTIRFGDGFGNFGNPTKFATGADPVAVAAGDLNQDGFLDLVTANMADSSVSFFRGLGKGKFAARLGYSVGAAPGALAIGDATGDGRLDVVTANTSVGSVTVLTGSAGPGGLTGATLTLPTNAGPSAVALGDLDGNGVNDIVTANSNATVISVLRGQAAGGFAPKVDYATASGPAELQLGDLDNDGDLDIVTVSRVPGKLSTLLNNGAGAFPFHDDLPISNDVVGSALVDVDGDAIPDMVIGIGGGVTVLVGSGFGTFYIPQAFTTDQGATMGLAVGDIDDDGRVDLLATCQSTAVVAFLAAVSPFGAHQDFAAGTSPLDVAVADVNGDSLPDLVSANNGSANVSVLVNAGAGSFPTHTEYATPRYPNIVRLGDLGADGQPEILVGTFSPFYADTNRVYVFPNLGNGTFGTRSQLDLLESQDGINGMALGDINRDTHLDFVDTHSFTNGTRIWFGNGSGGFTSVPPLVTGLRPAGVALADVNADSTLDLLLTRFGSDTVSDFRGDGAGNFMPPLTFFAGASGPTEVTAGDVDADGKVDLAVLDQTSRSIAIFQGTGTGGFAQPEVKAVQANSGLALRDVNRDGIVDLVFGSDAVSTKFGQGTGTIGQGNGVFGLPIKSAPLGEKYGLALSDLDRNGTVDAVVALFAGNAVSVLYGLQQTRTGLTVSPNPSPINGPLTLTAPPGPIRAIPRARSGSSTASRCWARLRS
jgi:hypothetical protein